MPDLKLDEFPIGCVVYRYNSQLKKSFKYLRTDKHKFLNCSENTEFVIDNISDLEYFTLTPEHSEIKRVLTNIERDERILALSNECEKFSSDSVINRRARLAKRYERLEELKNDFPEYFI